METGIPPALPPKAKGQTIPCTEVTEERNTFHDNIQSPDDLSVVMQNTESHSDIKEKLTSDVSLGSRPIPAPRLSKKKTSGLDKVIPQPKLSFSVPSSTHFFNPLYYAVNSEKPKSGEVIEVRETFHKRSSSDTDSIRFLEKHKPVLIKEEWVPRFEKKCSSRKLNIYNDNNRLSSLLDRRGLFVPHVYEMCEKNADVHSYEIVEPPPYEGEIGREHRDIFDSVFFKSPLYEACLDDKNLSENKISEVQCLDVLGKTPKSFPLQLHSGDLYDTPRPEIPPPSYPPPPLPLDVLLSTDENGLPVCNLDKVKLTPAVPPRPIYNPLLPSKKEKNHGVVESSSEICSSHINKNTVPTRPAPPVPRTISQMYVPPPVPQRTLNSSTNSSYQEVACPSIKNELALTHIRDVNLSRQETRDYSAVKNVNGFLYKTGSNRKEFLLRWCVLENGNFAYYLDKKAVTPKDIIKKEDILGVTVASPYSIGSAQSNLHLCCFEMSTSRKEHGRQYLFGAKSPSERQEWIDHLSIAIGPEKYQFLPSSGNIIQSGYLHMKEGTTGQWQMAWVVLYKRTLLIFMLDLEAFQAIDLRKSMGVVKLPSTSSQICAAAYEPGPVFHIDMPQQVLYLQGEWPHHTETWFQNVYCTWSIPDSGLVEDQYLTQDNIPVIIDKCLNFISTHGITDENIYRAAGSLTKVKKLLDAFSQNAWNVHLKSDEYSHHEASTALKRFLRSLSDCLLTEKLYVLWVKASEIEDQDERLKCFKDLLQKLPTVNYQTLKRLIGHLFSISEHSDKNLMPVVNLAVVFGPNIIFKPAETDGFDCTSAALDIVSDFITHYSWLFQVNPEEIEKERKIQQALELLREARIAQRPAGDILVGVYVYSKDWGKCLNVRLTPSMTAEQLCEHAISHAGLKETLDKIAVFEVVSNEELERPLHYTEIVLAVTLRWASWADADAKSNYLCIKHNYIFDAVMPFVQSRQPLSMFSELKFADSRSKTFKKLLFEFIGAKLTCYKDARASRPVGQWNVEDITWYVGAESKRPPPTKWTFTFIDRNSAVKRTKDNPYFGRTVCCSLEEEYFKWLAAMLVGEHSQNLFPSQQQPDLLT